MSSIEKLLNAVINGDDISDFIPESRTEEYLKRICLKQSCDDLTPQSRVEVLLLALSKVVIDGETSSGTLPSGTFTITENGSYNISQYANVIVNVSETAVAKIVVNATDSETGDIISDITATVLSATNYKGDDGYYYIPASDTSWTVRVTATGYSMASTTFTVSEEEAEAGEKIINIAMNASA